MVYQRAGVVRVGSMNRYLKNFCIGTYVLLCGVWMIFLTVSHCVRLLEMFTSENFSIEYFRMTLNIFIGSFVADALWLISGFMCVIAFVKLKSGVFIVRAGIISFVSYLIPCITNYLYWGRLHSALYLIMPILMIACGKYWARYMGGQNPDDIPDKAFPFIDELKRYIKQKRETVTENPWD